MGECERDFTEDSLLGGRVRLIQPRRGHRVGTDAVLLAASADARAEETVYDLGAGVTWGLSRSLDFNANVSWEKTVQQGNPESSIFTAGIGLTLKR